MPVTTKVDWFELCCKQLQQCPQKKSLSMVQRTPSCGHPVTRLLLAPKQRERKWAITTMAKSLSWVANLEWQLLHQSKRQRHVCRFLGTRDRLTYPHEFQRLEQAQKYPHQPMQFFRELKAHVAIIHTKPQWARQHKTVLRSRATISDVMDLAWRIDPSNWCHQKCAPSLLSM